MREFIRICCSVVLSLLRIILFPLKIVVYFIYPDARPTTVGYAWYPKDEYQKLIDSSRDNLEELVPTYDLWKTKADENIEYYRNKGYLVVKVNIQVKELDKWLLANALPNTGENRQKYVNLKMKKFFENGVI